MSFNLSAATTRWSRKSPLRNRADMANAMVFSGLPRQLNSELMEVRIGRQFSNEQA